jgi:hypothetical protein
MADEKKPDTSNFVEHLRLVHLTLALTCLISIVAVFSQDESSPKRAFEQVGLLIKLRDKWNHGDWIRDKIEAPRTPPERDATVVVNDRPPERWRFSPSIQFIRKDGTPVQRSNGKPISAKSETGSDFEDLDHVKFIWDALKDVAQVMVPTEVHDGWSFSNSTQPAEAHINGGNGLKLRETGDAASADQSHARELGWTIQQNIHGVGDVAANFIKDRKDESFFLSSMRFPRLIRPGDTISFIFAADIFPAVAEKTDINLLVQFKEGTAAADLPAGSFDVAFPDLLSAPRATIRSASPGNGRCVVALCVSGCPISSERLS